MDKKTSKRNFWELAIPTAVILSLIMGSVNTYLIKKVKDEKNTICVVDIWKLSSEKAIELSKSDKSQEEVRSALDNYIKTINQNISRPQQYGCSFIAVKGAILGSNVKDITEDIYKAAEIANVK